MFVVLLCSRTINFKFIKLNINIDIWFKRIYMFLVLLCSRTINFKFNKLNISIDIWYRLFNNSERIFHFNMANLSSIQSKGKKIPPTGHAWLAMASSPYE
jgi:hypothetical protein